MRTRRPAAMVTPSLSPTPPTARTGTSSIVRGRAAGEPPGLRSDLPGPVAQVRAGFVHELTGAPGQGTRKPSAGFHDLAADDNHLDVCGTRAHHERGDRITETVQVR